MAGGQYTDFNKTLPGLYLRYKTKPDLTATVGERGTVAIAKQLKFGTEGAFIEISDLNKLQELVGFDISSEDARFIREMMRGTESTKGASKILLWRLEEQNSKKASLTCGNLIATAKTTGSDGNKISIEISPDTSSQYTDGGTTKYAKWTVKTYFDNVEKDSQTVGEFTSQDDKTDGLVENLTANEFVEFSGTGTFTAQVSTKLEGGQDAGVTTTAYSNFLKALGKKNFNVVCYDGTDTVQQTAFQAFVKRMCEEEGKYCVLVTANMKTADSEYVISVDNGVKIDEGVLLTPAETTWWVAGATAGANYNESLTYHRYPGSTDLSIEYEQSELVEKVKEGQFTFIKMDGEVLVLTDINTFHTFTVDKSRSLSKNRVVRVVMQICNDLYLNISKTYIGKVDVNPDGVKLVKGFIVGYLESLQANRAIKNFSQDDVTVAEFEVDSMKAELYVQPVDSLEKIYINMLIG